MKYQKINFENPEKEILAEIVSYLKKGKVVVLPTDTIYGLSCLATSSKAIKKIAAIKERPLEKNKPFLVLVSSVAQAQEIAHLNNFQNQTWKKLREKKSVTIILPGKGVLAKELENKEGNLGLRLPASDFLRKIIKLSGCPLVSTSFNIHNDEPFSKMTEAHVFFQNRTNQPDLVVDGGHPKKNKPSMLVDLSGDKEIILRK